MKRKLSTVLNALFAVHLAGFLAASWYFSWQLSQRKPGFLDWLALDDWRSFAKGMVWEWYVVAGLVSGGSRSPAAANEEPPPEALTAWWKNDYPAFVLAVDRSPGHAISIPYQSARGEPVALTFVRDATGMIVSVKGAKVLIVFRDHDLDGSPDDYSISDDTGLPVDASAMAAHKSAVAAGKSSDDAFKYTKDGFMKVSPDPAFDGTRNMWNLQVGVGVASVLHRYPPSQAGTGRPTE